MVSVGVQARSPGISDRGVSRRALVYRALGLGDLLTGVPALRALRRALPGHRIVLAAPATQRPLVELIGGVDEVVPTDELAPVTWGGEPPDVAVDLHGSGPASRELLGALDPQRLVGFGLGDGPAWDPDEHERARWCRLVADSFGASTDPDDMRLDESPVDSPAPDAVVVHPGAAYGSRRWPAERFARVAQQLSSAGERVVVTGGAAEVRLAEEVAVRAGLPREAVLAGRIDLLRLAALVGRARLVICGDTGVGHMASAYGTPSVLLFGPTPPAIWGPPPGPHHVLWHGAGRGDPHGSSPDPALLRIEVAEVLAAATEVLNSAAARVVQRG